MKGIAFQASLYRITTTVDGGWRVSFDVAQSESEAMLSLSKKREKPLQLGVVDASAISEDTGDHDE